MSMTYPEPRLTLREVMHARSVAVIGASDDISKWGGRALAILCQHDVPTEIYPVNPKADQVMGLKAYRSIADCPKPVDIAMILVPSVVIADTVQACAQAGVGCAIVITAGFAESSEEGRALELQMVEQARQSGMRIIGPNCIGILNAQTNMLASTAVALTSIERAPAGHIGFASQSGALMGSMLARGVDVGAGFSSLISLGNQCDIDITECFEYLIDDPLTHVVCLYVEALKDPAKFRRLLARARERGKPVVVCKSGRSQAGERAVQSHTASMAGAYAAFEAICRSEGAYLFHNVSDMLDAAMLIERGARLTGKGIAVFSGSGGAGALLVDALDQAGFETPTLAPETLQKLETVLPPSNLQIPIDFGTLLPLREPHPDGEDPWEVALALAMQDRGVSGGLVMLTSQPTMDRVASAAQRVGVRIDKPLLYIHIAGSIGDPARRVMRETGYGFVESQNDAVAVFNGLRQRELMPLSTTNLDASDAIASIDLSGLPEGYLTEPQARGLLESVGITMSPWRLAATVQAAQEAFDSFGVTCVVKAVSSTLVHKSDAGAVKLNLRTAEQVRDACLSIEQSVQAAGHAVDGFLVTPMVSADAELILGVQRDPSFGPMVLLGAGGTLVELLHDVQMMPADLSKAQALAMIKQLRCLPLLTGWRGTKAADLDALADIVVSAGRLALADVGLQELDINPLMLVDGQFMGVDARAVRRLP